MRNAADVEAAHRAEAASEYLHIHAQIAPTRFMEEWSRYDAGVLHVPRPDDPFRVLNMPNRYSAYLAAGVPVALPATQMPAMQRQLERFNAAVVYESAADVVEHLPDATATAGALEAREAVTFEAIFPALVRFVRSCVG